jgi:tRNA(His) guanylyltransferase
LTGEAADDYQNRKNLGMDGEDDFGDRMKAYEAVETSRRFDVHLPIYARIDGRAFSTFTRGMEKPFDMRLIDAMVKTTRYLVEKTHARIGYCQSDEISLVWLADKENSDVFFSGKTMKMASVLASMAAAKFARVCPEGFEDRLPHFDCRVHQMPSKTEAANAFLWRAMDARKNAISMVAQSRFSPRQLHGKRQADMLEMLSEIGVDFESLPSCFKHGSFLRRETVEREMTPDELARIPKEHWPDGPVKRSAVSVLDVPFFRDIKEREAFVFRPE